MVGTTMMHFYKVYDTLVLAKPSTWGIIFIVFLFLTPVLIKVFSTEGGLGFGYDSNNYNEDNYSSYKKERRTFPTEEKKVTHNNADLFNEDLNKGFNKKNYNTYPTNTFLYSGFGKEEQNTFNPFVEKTATNNKKTFTSDEHKDKIEVKINKRIKKNKNKKVFDMEQHIEQKINNVSKDNVIITFD